MTNDILSTSTSSLKSSELMDCDLVTVGEGTVTDNCEAFKEAMRANGLEPPEHIEPGRIHRFPGVGEHNGDKAWCIFFPDGVGGSFGDWSGFTMNWQAESAQPRTREEQATFYRQVKESRKQAEQQQREEQEAAAAKARRIWDAAQPASSAHPYLAKKHILAHGTKQDGDRLLLPMRDETGKLWALQTIDPNGIKRFHPAGCRVKGLYFSLRGKPKPGNPVCIAEGFATAAAINEAGDYPVAVAFSAGNLERVALILKEKLPGQQLILCADDDRKDDTDHNTGFEAATRAAMAVGGRVVVPDMGCKADFWDLCDKNGREAVKAITPGHGGRD